MFIHDFVHIARPVQIVQRQLLAAADERMCALAADAYQDGEELLRRVEHRTAPPPSGPGVQVLLGTPYARKDGTVTPMSWITSGQPGSFPSMEADLEIAALGVGMTQMTLSGMYEIGARQPGARAGAAALMHRIAEATVRSFLTRMAADLALCGCA